MDTVKFSVAKLPNNKHGIMKPDSDGYYTQTLGGLNVFNSVGQYYTLEGAKDLFEKSSSFQRKVQRGALRGEVGHPRQLPGMSEDQYLNRILDTDETNTCCQFAEIWLDFDNFRGKNGEKIVGIVGKVIPSGAKGEALAKAFENPKENVCFSIRSFTRDYMQGTRYCREIKQIVTFDWVNEPGIEIAEKFKTPGLENIDDHTFTKSQVERIMSKHRVGLGTESACFGAKELFSALGWDRDTNSKSFLKW